MLKGVWIHPMHPSSDILACVEDLERSDLGQVWIGDEGVSRDPFVLLAACALRTSHIEFGIAVTNPLLRHPGAVASAASTLAELSNDRFILGWGTGGEESLGPFGLTVSSPLQILEHAIAVSRAVLRGEATDSYQPPSHAIPPRSVRQYVGARGPLLNSMASRIADGVFLSGLDDDLLEDRIRRARSVRPIEVAICQTVKPTGSPDSGTLVGSPRSIAERINEISARFRPTSLCVACVDPIGLSSSVDFSLAILDDLRDVDEL